ncbi:MAG TPA: DUF3011 domain-containing protein [Casimicrobiaceae bacterium]|nr:DUF3011 domain-containing protein [Casimicrobiaceae bacterium]
MKALQLVPVAALVALSAATPVLAQSRIDCESRDYQYNFCATPDGVARARLIEQRSRSQCVEGRTWGFDRRGIWVSGGCEGAFEYAALRGPGPGPGGPAARGVITCESRDYRQEFCQIPDGVDNVTMVRQRSRAPCVQGQSWGWRGNGIWVSNGCEADFEVHTAGLTPGRPPRQGHVVCESREYRYNFCDTGRIRDAQLVDQRSQAACVRGRSWGVERNGIWVDDGCEAEFRVITR